MWQVLELKSLRQSDLAFFLIFKCWSSSLRQDCKFGAGSLEGSCTGVRLLI